MLSFVYVQRFTEEELLNSEQERSAAQTRPVPMLTYTPGKYVIYKFPESDVCTMCADGGELIRGFDSEAEARLYAAARGWDVVVDKVDWHRQSQRRLGTWLVF